ncbi:MAG: glycosyl hydrolase-related protein, partial [Bacilli bacterium]|nr:glycosyl hydrolase-related protein [Bacilli bacterium]
AYLLNRPLIANRIRNQGGRLPSSYSFATCLAKGVYMETLKKADESDATILRLYEGLQERKEVTIRFHGKIEEASLCNLLEEDEFPLKVVDNSVTFDIRPFEIVTIKVK